MRLHALQYLRAIAALAVVYGHAVIQVPNYEARLIEFGSFGVDIFFVISGFIMIYIAKPGDTPSKFMINRFRRVAPLYWFFTLLMAALLFVLPTLFKNTQLEWGVLIKSLLFIPHFSSAHPGEVWPIVAPGWSLNFEMYFYLLFAISLFFAERTRVWFIALSISGIFLAAKVAQTGGPYNAFLQDDIVFEFIFGMLLAKAWQNGLRLGATNAMLLFLAGMGLLLWHSQHLGLASTGLPGIITNGIPALMVVCGCLYMKVPNFKSGVILGDASYALYLSHIFVLGLLRKILPPMLGDSNAAAYSFVLICIVVCLLVSIPVHFLIDNWLLRVERLKLLKSDKSSKPGKTKQQATS